ncbi:hypothetical protein [Gulosibacter bifidus]|uniref:DUF4190 domain-containing protein n=1 Tax=Gulosibacter bifidus TaxID=272239 RepID=A0ABW5RKS2_9MICO|nr:hypothetical protein [Gulosibacter bifidus]
MSSPYSDGTNKDDQQPASTENSAGTQPTGWAGAAPQLGASEQPGAVMPQYGASSQPGGAPRYGNSGYPQGGPQYGQPQYGAPQYGGPQYGPGAYGAVPNPGQPPFGAPPATPGKTNVPGIVGSIIAFIGIVLAFFPVIGIFGILAGLVAAGLGIAGCIMSQYRGKRAWAIVAIISGVVAMFLGFVLPVVLLIFGIGWFIFEVTDNVDWDAPTRTTEPTSTHSPYETDATPPANEPRATLDNDPTSPANVPDENAPSTKLPEPTGSPSF